MTVIGLIICSGWCVSAVRGLTRRVVRIARQRGSRRLARDGVAMLVEDLIAPRLRDYFERRALTERDLVAICRSEGSFFDHYGPRETFQLDLPTTPTGYSGHELEYMTETYLSEIAINAPYVCELRDVDLVGPHAVPVKDGCYVYENSLESWQRLTTSCILALGHGTVPRQRRRGTGDRLDDVVSLVGPWNANYTHWFQDYLARLEGLEHYVAATDRRPDVLIPSNANQWMLDAIRAMGYPPDRWIEWKGGRLNVDRFVVASVRREARERAVNRRLLYSPTEFEWIRDRVLANVEPERTCPHAPRIYISRAGATVRRVENETETMDLLTEWDFVRYAPEDLSFAEQVTLFSQAEAIVAPHGAGLMNQIWADEATVIEIFGPKHGVTDPAMWYYLADLLGHDYGCLQGETVGPDVRVDIDALESLLGRMLEA